MIRSIFIPKHGPRRTNIDPSEMHDIMGDPEDLLWVSLENPTRAEFDRILTSVFQFHPLTIEDCANVGYQTPKVDDFESYLFVIMHAIHLEDGLEELGTKELDIFLGPNYLVTSFTSENMSPVDKVWRRLDQDERLIHHGADFLMHAILDEMVDEYLPMLDQLDEEVDLLEDQILQTPRQATLSRILTLKHRTLGIRRIVGPQREVMNRLSRDEFTQVDAHSRVYFRDIYDHLVRITELSESSRDLISDALSTYLSATSNRLNEIMKALTIVSTIFLPLSFVAGNYGMNFKYMPEINWQYGYPFVIVIYILIIAGMLTYFKRRGWF